MKICFVHNKKGNRSAEATFNKHLYSEVRVTGGFSGFSCYADVKLSQCSFDKMPRREILNKQLKYEFIPSLPARISGDAVFLVSL